MNKRFEASEQLIIYNNYFQGTTFPLNYYFINNYIFNKIDFPWNVYELPLQKILRSSDSVSQIN